MQGSCDTGEGVMGGKMCGLVFVVNGSVRGPFWTDSEDHAVGYEEGYNLAITDLCEAGLIDNGSSSAISVDDIPHVIKRLKWLYTKDIRDKLADIYRNKDTIEGYRL